MRTVTIGARDYRGPLRGPRARRDAGMALASAHDRHRHDTAPDPIFSPEDGLEELWVKAYQGEVLGELLFGGIADELEDPDQAATSADARHPGAADQGGGRAGARAGRHLHRARSRDGGPRRRRCCPARWPCPGSDLMATFGPITAQYIPLYQRIGELSPAERETADLLVAHEVALRDFARGRDGRRPRPRSSRSWRWPTCADARGLPGRWRPASQLAGRSPAWAGVHRGGPIGPTPAWNPGTHPPYHGGEGHGPCRPLPRRGRTRRPLPRPCRGRSLSRPG